MRKNRNLNTKKMKTKVYCDTMIWYGLAEGKITLDKSRYYYLGSASNIVDFISSDKPNIGPVERNQIRDAILAMEEHADEICFEDPFSFGSRRLFGLQSDKNELAQIQNIYTELLRFARGEIQGLYGPGISSTIAMKEAFRTGTLSVAQQYKTLFSTKRYNKKQKHEIVLANARDFIFRECSNFKNIKKKPEDAFWLEIDLFVKAYTNFILSASHIEKPNKNTAVDLLQIFYLDSSPNKLLWTKECKIIKKIKNSNEELKWRDILYKENLTP